MESYRKRYFNSHTLQKVPANNKKGYKNVYVYTGNWYEWDMSPGHLRKDKQNYLILLIIAFIFFLFAALQFSSLNSAPVIAIPSIFSLVGFMYEIIGVIQFCCTKEKIKEIDIRDIQNKIAGGSSIHSLMMALTVIACIVILCLQDFSVQGVLVTICYLISALSSYRIHRLQKTITAHKCAGSPVS